ncbi:SMI1/KNR4 family protein [Bacillus haynesii]|uniref:SMI1/KNR4 family protein n=1 Tax=Bacillus haynesii TaxID=1925021 RepID=UPI002280A97C|nr:SMI1/KNR4 family protein [Bacillus haynesii]MCY8343155.1 SMI1/KNR4 family protein [Bacillus haynesii]MCY9151128.1 SMI1/KNR4 family protein [Bacillus haynesii]
MSFKRIEQKMKEFLINIDEDSNNNSNIEIEDLEKKLGKQLHSDYKKFLAKYGGCSLESRKTNDDVEFDVCYRPIEKDPWMGVNDETQLLESFYGFQTNADNVMDIDNEKILFWDHESSHPDKDFFLIANSFEEFILSLVDEPIGTDDNDSDVEIEILDNDFGKLLFGKDN